MLQKSSVAQLQMREGPSPALLEVMEKPPDLGKFEKAQEGDFVSELDKLVKQHQQETSVDDSAFRVELFDPSSLTEFPGTRLDKLLHEARKLIADEEFSRAQRPLAEALEMHPGHHEATYLLALCQYRVAQPEQALETLLPLRQARLERTLADRLSILTADIRRQMLLPVMLDNLLLLMTGKHQLAAQRLQRLVQLDPGAGMYYYMLGGALMNGNQIGEALQAVEVGLTQCEPSDRRMLTALQQQVKRRYVRELLEPARRLYKAQSYKKARSRLENVPVQYRDSGLYKSFDSLLGDLQPKGWGPWASRKGPEDLPAPRNPKQAEPLYSFLAGEEIREGRRQLERGNLAKAGQAYERAISLTPHFPYAHYLYAGYIYGQLVGQMVTGAPPTLDQLVAGLEKARHHARIGVKDRDIPDAAAMRDIIERTLQSLEKARAEAKARRREVKLVNELIQEFEAIMTKAEGGIGSPQQFNEIFDRVGKLKRRIPGARRQVQSSDGTEALDRLSEAVDRNYQQLEGMQDQVQESGVINELSQEFAAIMNKAEGGIGSPQQFNEVFDRMGKLKRRIPGVRRQLRSSEGKQALDQLSEALGRNYRQLEGMQDQVRESGIVNGYMAQFNYRMMQLESQGGIKSRSQLLDERSFFRNLRSDIQRDISKVSSPEGKKQMRELLEAIDRILSQLG